MHHSPQRSSSISAETPGSGLVTHEQYGRWQRMLSKLPDEVASDPSARFCNPALLDGLESITQSGRLALSAYEAAATKPIASVPDQQPLLLSRNNPYHGLDHSLIEVPHRTATILNNLKGDAPIDAKGCQQFMRVCAEGHDLLHAGVGYAQRLTPGLNISNEERAVIRLAAITLAHGWSPIQALEMQRIILPTSFFQKAAQLGLEKDPEARMPYVSGVAAPVRGVDARVWGQHDFAKKLLAREYDPEASHTPSTRAKAQILCLADVLVTLDSFEDWMKNAAALFLEAKIGQGYYPKTLNEFAEGQSGFINGHVTARLNACAPFLDDAFVSLHRERIEQFATRLTDAKQALTDESKADAVWLQGLVGGYMHHEGSVPPSPFGLNFDFLRPPSQLGV